MIRKAIPIVLLSLATILLLVSSCSRRAPTQEIIVDNLDPGFAIIAGDWGEAGTADGNGSYGPDFRYHLADRSKVGIARFTPTISQVGSYAVYIHWSADPNRTTDQPVIVHSEDGETAYHVNLQEHGHQWFPLGHHTFAAGTGGYVQFTTDTDSGYCNADAIRLVADF